VNNDKDQANLLGRFRVGGDALRLSVVDSFLSREEGVPGPGQFTAASARLWTLQNLGVALVEGKGGETLWKARIWQRIREERYDDTDGEVGVGSALNRDTNTTWGALANLVWARSPALLPSLTLAIRQDRYVARDDLQETESPPRLRRSASATPSLMALAWRELLQVDAAARLVWIESADREDDALEDATRAVTGRSGLLLRPHPDLALKASVGRFLRPPDFWELFGDRGAVIGNADLRPESGWQWDVGARYAVDTPALTASVDLAHFWNSTTDLITYVQNTQKTMVPTNIGKAWVQGLEAAVALAFLDTVESRSNLTWNVSVNLSEREGYANNQLPGIPTWEFHQQTAIFSPDRWRLGHSFSYTAGSYWDETNWYLSAPRLLHGLFARTTLGRTGMELELEALNLADHIVEVVPRNPLDATDDASILSPISDFNGYPLPGRTVLLSLRWEGQAPGSNP
jgi:iron complex outermembrane receptor protein